MSTVDAHFGRKILEKTGIIYHNSIMKHIAGRGTVQAVFGHILCDRTAEGNIDDLHALADPDDRDSGGNRYVESLELQDVQFGVNSAGTFVFFPEKMISGRLSVVRSLCERPVGDLAVSALLLSDCR